MTIRLLKEGFLEKSLRMGIFGYYDALKLTPTELHEPDA